MPETIFRAEYGEIVEVTNADGLTISAEVMGRGPVCLVLRPMGLKRERQVLTPQEVLSFRPPSGGGA
jgi:hypothetical protein